MKLLIGCVVALLCLQSLRADDPDPQCEDLAAYKDVVKTFFQYFEAEHGVAHEDLVGIQNICTTLTQALETFSSPSYGSNQTDEETICQISQFFENFFVMRIAALQYITHLRYYCDVLLNMFDDFRRREKPVCIANSSSTGCAAELNDEQCQLLEFADGLAVYGAQAKDYLDGLLSSCDGLGLLASGYDFEYDPTCEVNSSNGNTITAFKNDFIPPFVTLHDEAHGQLESVTVICNSLTDYITYWSTKYD